MSIETILTTILAPAVGVLFWQLIKQMEQRITDCKEENKELKGNIENFRSNLMPAVATSTQTQERLIKVVEEQAKFIEEEMKAMRRDVADLKEGNR